METVYGESKQMFRLLLSLAATFLTACKATYVVGQSTCTTLGVIAFYSASLTPFPPPNRVCPDSSYQIAYTTGNTNFNNLLNSVCSCYSQVGFTGLLFTLDNSPSQAYMSCVNGTASVALTEIMTSNYKALCVDTVSEPGSTTVITEITITYLSFFTSTATSLLLTTTTTTTSFSRTLTTSSTLSKTVSTISTATLTVEFDFTSTRTLDSRTRVPVTETETTTTNLAQTDTIILTSTLRTSLTTTRTKTITTVETFYSLSCPRQSTFTVSTLTTGTATSTITRCSTRTRKTTKTVVLDDPSFTKMISSTRTLVSVETTSTTTITTVSGACGSKIGDADFRVCNLKNGMILVHAQVAHANAHCVCKHFSRQLAALPDSNDIYALKSLMAVDIFGTCRVNKAWINSETCKAIVKVDEGNAILPHNCENRLAVLCAAWYSI